jgi:hypothetical protein
MGLFDQASSGDFGKKGDIQTQAKRFYSENKRLVSTLLDRPQLIDHKYMYRLMEPHGLVY